MNKKPGLLLAVSVLAIIILAASVDFTFPGTTAVHLRAGVNPDNVLYLCPMASNFWDSFANAMTFGRKYIYMFFIFLTIILIFSWSWGLYQNLLKDKFSADAYKNPWTLTKMFFWVGVICTLLVVTPNYFRAVHVRINGHDTEWVLCESTSNGARAVNARAVTVK